MDSYQRLQIKRVRNGYIVGPVEPHFDHHLPNAHAINVFQDFDDLTAHLEMLLGDPATEQAAQAEADAMRFKEEHEVSPAGFVSEIEAEDDREN